MEIAIGAIAAVFGGIIATIAANYIWKKYDDRITVKRITNPKDKDIKRLIELYVGLFPDESTNYSGRDIIKIIEQQNHEPELKHVKADDIFLVAKCKGDVVGFLFCHYYKERNKAIISYYGIDKSSLQARIYGTDELIRTIQSYLISEENDCEYLFFDVEDPSSTRAKDEKRKRRARKAILRQTAIEIGLTAYELRFDYHTPKINLAEAVKEAKLSLMVIPLSGSMENSLPRSTVCKFLDFIYLDCYGDFYEVTDSRYEDFKKHLLEKLDKIKKEIPENVIVE